MLTLEEKQALQTFILQACQAQKNQPTLLLDALLNGTGYALVHSILSQQHTDAVRSAQMAEKLLTAIRVETVVPESEVA